MAEEQCDCYLCNGVGRTELFTSRREAAGGVERDLVDCESPATGHVMQSLQSSSPSPPGNHQKILS